MYIYICIYIYMCIHIYIYIYPLGYRLSHGSMPCLHQALDVSAPSAGWCPGHRQQHLGQRGGARPALRAAREAA